MKLFNLTIIVILLCLTACGGSSEHSPDPNNPEIPDNSILGPSNNKALVGESVGLVLLLEESFVYDLMWTQTAGPTVSFLGANRKVIGFDVTEVGVYSFRVSYLNYNGQQESASYSFEVSSESEVYVNARVDHEANSMAKVSLSASFNLPGQFESINWRQTSGPTAELTSTDELNLIFNSPEVNQDEVLQFEVTVIDDLGNESSDAVYVLLEPEYIHPNSHFAGGHLANNSIADVYPYVRNSPYADDLVECTYSNTSTGYCNLGRLPFIGNETVNPTVEDIMQRVVVSHDWMGLRFQQFLEQVDTYGDIKKLLGATTAIVIAYDIRPAFYWSGSGAIYLDPVDLWLTPEERDTINIAPDFRNDFGNDLQFRDLWRIVKDNENIFVYYPRDLRLSRTIEDSKFAFLHLLYHELAHANDFYPRRVWQSYSEADFTYSHSLTNHIDSTILALTYPLVSQEMFQLGEVLFQGVTSTTSQANYTPVDVSNFFFPDDATNTYSYSNSTEDYAMLAEEYLMSYRYNVSYDQAITGLAPEYIVNTGERGRVGHERIKVRAEFVISQMMPDLDISTASTAIPTPITLNSGVNWWDSIVPGTNKFIATEKTKHRTPPLQIRRIHHQIPIK